MSEHREGDLKPISRILSRTFFEKNENERRCVKVNGDAMAEHDMSQFGTWPLALNPYRL
jgi:hypothetical protein